MQDKSPDDALAKMKELREKTGYGLMECRSALTENDWDMEKSINYLRSKSLNWGVIPTVGEIKPPCITIISKISDDKEHGVMLEIITENKWITRQDIFHNFCDLMMYKVLYYNSVDDISGMSKEIIEEFQNQTAERISIGRVCLF